AVVAGLPPLPQVPALGSLLSPVSGAAPAAGQLAATPARRNIKKAQHRDDESGDGKGKGSTDDKDPAATASGSGESDRAPLPTEFEPSPAALQGTVAARFYPDDPPGPPAGTPPQARR